MEIIKRVEDVVTLSKTEYEALQKKLRGEMTKTNYSCEKNCKNCCNFHCIPEYGECETCDAYPEGDCPCKNCNEFSNWKPDHQTLESELQQYKEALEAAIDDLRMNFNCPTSSYPCHESRDCTQCFIDYYLTKAKRVRRWSFRG